MAVSEFSVVHPGAKLGRNVAVAPFAVIEDDVNIGNDCEIGPQVVLRSRTRIGAGCRLRTGAVIGDTPMDVAYRQEKTGVSIGRNNDLREYVTVHRSTGRDTLTVIGDDNLIMPYSHIAHNCRIGNRVTITNACQLAGYVEVDDRAVLGGMTGVHQHVRIGSCAMVGACSYLSKDVPPFMLGAGNPFQVRGINTVGLKRAGFSSRRIELIREVYRVIYRSRLNLTQALREIRRLQPESSEVRSLVAFARASRRGLYLK